ncbi:MAG: hypothetical protein ACRDT4_05105 [Micromonosporaceae bacterium]
MGEPISERLREKLEFCAVVEDVGGPNGLGASVRSGHLSWFLQEFEQALRSHAFTIPLWDAITDMGLEDDRDWIFVDDDLREIWYEIAPDRVYPYDEPDTPPPPGWVDHLTDDGISDRLAFTLKRHLRGARDRPPPEPGHLPVGLVAMFGRTVARGRWSWLPQALEHAVRTGALTYGVWGRLVYDDPRPDPRLAAQDIHQLWESVIPDKAYPGNDG